MKMPPALSIVQKTMLVLLRTAIGWHFLYEGVSKWLTPGWSAEGFLLTAQGPLKGFFVGIAENPLLLSAANHVNMYALAIIGACLLLGLFSRLASVAGALLIVSFYLAHPPWPGMDFGAVREGSYLYIDKNFVEFVVLCVLAFFRTGAYAGLDSFLLPGKPKVSGGASAEAVPAAEAVLPRRSMIRGMATVPMAVAFGAAMMRKNELESHEEKNLVDGISRATIKTYNFSSLKDLTGKIPTAPIANVPFSRVILGGNLIGGWAHARDLIYVSKLVKAYHTRDKVFETFLLAENCGINAILTNPILCDIINEYWKRNIGRIKFISDCGGEEVLESIRISIDRGAAACYVQGATADHLVAEGKLDVIAKALDLIRQNKLPAGIGGHYLETVKACADYGLSPDFWMKTLHTTNYWSARNPDEHDNIFCRDPEGTIAFMKERKEPWIAFKTLAAGALEPKDGFRYAFENGADFICVGMYDFQIVDDANIALSILNERLPRERPWIA